MATENTDRRQFLSAVGAGLGVALVAGCLGDEGGQGEEDDRGEDDQDAEEPVVDVAETTVTNTDPDLWADVDSIRFDGWVGGWVGVEPDVIDRVENPTLVLVEGREYEFTWENMDEVHHNIALLDSEEDVVGEYSTPGTEVEGESEHLTFEATAAMETYRCEYQPAVQNGEIIVLEEL